MPAAAILLILLITGSQVMNPRRGTEGDRPKATQLPSVTALGTTTPASHPRDPGPAGRFWVT